MPNTKTTKKVHAILEKVVANQFAAGHIDVYTEEIMGVIAEVEKTERKRIKNILVKNHGNTHAILREECQGWDCQQFQYVNLSVVNIDKI